MFETFAVAAIAHIDVDGGAVGKLAIEHRKHALVCCEDGILGCSKGVEW